MPASEVVARRMGNTLLLGGTGFLLLFAGSLLLGLLCAWYEDRLLDRLVCRLEANGSPGASRAAQKTAADSRNTLSRKSSSFFAA